MPLGAVLEPLMVTEIAERWGWGYRMAYNRISRAFERQLLTQLKRPGRQPYYLAHQIEALFGPPPPPPNPDDGVHAPVKATKHRRHQFEFAFQDAA